MNKITKKAILAFSGGGELFFQLTLPHIKKKSELYYSTTSSPFRRDRNPSFQIFWNQSHNIWCFKDWGTNETGDIFEYAARLYKYDVKKDFKTIIASMFLEMELDKIESKLFEDYMTGKIVNIPINLKEEKKCKYVHQLQMKSEADLSGQEKKFLSDTGISLEVMTSYKAHFLRGYTFFSMGQLKNIFPSLILFG